MAERTDAGNGSDLTAAPLRVDSSTDSAVSIPTPTAGPSAPLVILRAAILLPPMFVFWLAGVAAGIAAGAFRLGRGVHAGL